MISDKKFGEDVEGNIRGLIGVTMSGYTEENQEESQSI
jgi:putative N-acetylmannosamine-6-phosphate epimerase